MTTKPFRFPKSRKSRDPQITARPKLVRETEKPLTRNVQGQPASDLEERFARALEKERIGYAFQFVHGAPKGLPGFQSLDFLVLTPVPVAVQVDDTTFIHKGTAAHDELVDTKTIHNLRRMGYGNIFPTVLHVTQEVLSNQEDANRFVSQEI